MADNGGGWNAPQFLEADQVVLLVDQGQVGVTQVPRLDVRRKRPGHREDQ